MTSAFWHHLSSLPYQFSTFGDLRVDSPPKAIIHDLASEWKVSSECHVHHEALWTAKLGKDETISRAFPHPCETFLLFRQVCFAIVF